MNSDTPGKPDDPVKTKPALKSRLGAAKSKLAPRNLRSLMRRHPRRTLTFGIAIFLLIVLLAVPMTRYKALALVIRKPLEVKIINAASGQPVSEASVNVGGDLMKTDANGIARFNAVPVGKQKASVQKSYYSDTASIVFVGIGKSKQAVIKVNATGKPVSVKILHFVTKKPVSNAVIKIAKATYRTKKDGTVQVLLASDAKEADAKISAETYNETSAKVVALASEKVDAINTFTITPSGKIYFLSKRTGKIDVMKSNLDGTDSQVVLKGTGHENDYDTILLASRDWKYLALKAKRDTKSNHSTLYVIDTANGDALIDADDGNANFTLAGWIDHSLVYSIYRNDLGNTQPGRFKIKSFDATNKKLTTIRQNNAEGDMYSGIFESFGTTYLTDKSVIYGTNWSCVSYYCVGEGKKIGFYSVSADGSNKKTLAEYDAPNNSLQYTPYGVNEFYIRLSNNSDGALNYYEYEPCDNKVSKVEITQDIYYKAYPTPIISPSAKLTFWAEARDGKNTILVGSAEGENEKAIATLEESNAYGWYTDDYLLISKKGSELHILPVGGGQSTKITDYHKPAYDFRGYGGGYGGF